MCMHVHMNGEQCRRVALTEKSYCHYHYKHYRHNNITDPDYELPILEDCRSVMLGIEELVRTRIKKKIDDKEMTAMMYAFQVASGMMNKAEALSPDITEEVLKNQAARTRRGTGRGKESETEEEADGEKESGFTDHLLNRLSEMTGIPIDEREDLPPDQRRSKCELLIQMIERARVKDPVEQAG